LSLRKIRIAIPSQAQGGLDDSVSNVFGRANTFTITDIEEGVIKKVSVMENPAVSYQHGAGPIVVKMLIDAGVNAVSAAEFGPGVSTLLDQHNVIRITVHSGRNVEETIKYVLAKIKK
jgi:predicted Fe-Mo cluster-binding NifX family protein